MHISDVTLIVTVSLRPCNLHEDLAVFDFLIGPTRARDLEAVILEQRSMSALRLQIQTLFSVLERLQQNSHLAEKFLEDAVSICGALEVLVVESLGALKVLNEKKLVPDDIIQETMHERRHYKAIIYINALRVQCSSLVQSSLLPNLWENGEAFSLFDRLMHVIDREHPLCMDAGSIASRVDSIVYHAVKIVRQMILCHPGPILADEMGMIGLVIDAFHSAAKKTVAVYESSDAGEELKMGVVKLLINSNTILADSLRPSLVSIGFQSTSALGLIDESRFDQLTEWYSSSLVATIKSWLRKNIDHMSSTKVVKYLPWDYEMVGDKILSPLPETFRFQLNAFLDLRVEIESYSNDGSQRSLRNQQLLMLNEKIISAVGDSLELLADEYSRALQSKHWGDGDFEEVDVHMKFLISCANDARRIQTVHVAPINDIQTTNEMRNTEISRKVKVAFEEVRNGALGRLSRVIFMDLQDYLSAFDSQWSNSDGNVLLGTILATLEDYWADFSKYLEEQNFLTLMGLNCSVCCAKYLTFLKNRVSRKSALNPEEIPKLVDDLTRIRKCFKNWVKKTLQGRSRDAATDVYRALKQIGDVNRLLTVKPVSELRQVVADILLRYEDVDTDTARAVLKLVTLRPDYDLEMINMISTEEKKIHPSLRKNGKFDEIAPVDLFVQVFRKDNDEHSTQDATSRLPGKLKVLRGIAKEFSLRKVTGRSLRTHSDHPITDSIDQSAPSLSRQSSRGNVANISDNITNDDICYVHVSNIKVRGLMSSSLIGLCNPYIAFTISAERTKTTVQWNRKSEAHWENELLSIPTCKSRLSMQFLSAEVFDKERIRRKKAIGSVRIKLSGLDTHSMESWFALDCIPPIKNCEIFLNLSLTSCKK